MKTRLTIFILISFVILSCFKDDIIIIDNPINLCTEDSGTYDEIEALTKFLSQLDNFIL